MTRVKRKRSVRWMILLGLAFVIALGIVWLILALGRPSPLFQGEQPGGVTLPVSLAESVTARSAYPFAVSVAQSWQPDGQLAIVSAHWRPNRGRWPTDVVWLFQFYSPSARRLAVVVVDGARAWLLQEMSSPYVVPTFSEDEWQVDSTAALDTWWNTSGASFKSVYSEIDVAAQLRVMDGGNDRLAWSITGIAGDRVKKSIIDGATGELVQD
ncbi:MAG: hypothetical protein GY832_27990 [Chloroflexi bacterium]|nr:hypothetical protein [Chloroflexota bacterium]